MKQALKRILPLWLKEPLRSGYLKYRSVRFLRENAGDIYECNFCGVTAARFIPGGKKIPVCFEKQIIGTISTKNVLCPRCFATDRQRLVKLAIERHCGTDLSIKVLHAAPERVLHRFMAQRYPNLQSCDLNPARYRAWARNMSQQDLTAMTFEDESFDLVVCNHVLEHIPDDRAAMREIFRILRPGGKAILQVPYSEIIEGIEEDPTVTSEEDRLRLYGQKDHVRNYQKAGYIERLEAVGFRSLVLGPETFRDDHRYAINQRESIFLVARP